MDSRPAPSGASTMRNCASGNDEVSDLPDGQFGEGPVQPRLQKYFRFLPTQITGLFCAVSSLTRGRWPSSRTLGWDAMDASAREDEPCSLRTAKSWGADASALASSSWG